jgi:hypothetical protein
MSGLILNDRNESVDAARESQSRNTYRRSNDRPRQGKDGESARAYGINFGNGRAVTKLLIEKGVISEEEFREKLMEERATYQKILDPTQQ